MAGRHSHGRRDPGQSPSVPTAYLKLILDGACGPGQRARETFLAGSGLRLATLDSHNAGVPFDSLARLLARAIDEHGPGWHLQLSQRLEAAIHGPLGFAALTAPTVGAALDVLVTCSAIRFPFLQFALDQSASRGRIVCLPTLPLGPLRQPVLELALCGVLSLLEQTTGRGRSGAAVELSGAAPAWAEALAAAVSVPVKFDAGRDAVSFPASWLALACPLADPSMHRLSLGRCRELLEQQSGRTALEADIRQELFVRCERPPGLAELAARRHMSARTLIRQLKRGGTSYQEILDDVRATLAVSLLRETDLPVAVIAHRLGFSDPSNFGRAFRLRHGRSPGRFRIAGD